MRKIVISISVLYAIFFGFLIGYLILQNNLESLTKIMFSSEIHFAIFLTLITASIATLATILFSVPIAYGLARYSFKGKKFVEVLTDIPIALPPILLSFTLLLVLTKSPLVYVFNFLNINILFTPLGIIIALFFYTLPEAIKILYSSFKTIDSRYHMVLRSLGYTEFQTFIKVDVPLAKNGLLSAIIVSLAKCIGAFGAILLVAGAIKGRTETLSIAIFLSWASGDMSSAIAASTVLIFISLILFVIFERIKK